MQHSIKRTEIMSSAEMKDRYELEYPAYQPDPGAIAKLQYLLADIQITIVLGKWCGDSQLQVPRFYKVLDEAGAKQATVQLICVNEMKQAADGAIDHLGIAHVPTFIFTANDKEIGRITESPRVTLENDMVIILEQNIQ